MKFLALVVVFLSSSSSWAFSEFVRHGYSSCIACHVSTNGGGMLNEYGRELSRELVSTWGTENESQFAYGAVELPEWLGVGGDLRWLQITQSNDQFDRGLFFNMQADLELAVFLGRVTAVGTVGAKTGVNLKDPGVLSRRHYLSMPIGESFNLRAGKFFSEYGILNPNHNRFVRNFFGYNQGDETYNLELSYNAEKFNIFLTGLFGRIDAKDSADQKDKGVAASFNYFLAEKHRIGASFRHGASNGKTKEQIAAFAVLGFTKKLYLMTEFDFKRTFDDTGATADTDGWANVMKVGYEFIKGWNVYGIQEHSDPDIETTADELTAIGGGLQIFPRPHFEFSAEFLLRSVPTLDNFSEKYATFVLHYYL